MSATDRTMMDRRVIVVGGYGHVGRRLAELLAPTCEVVIAGRRGERAATVAAELGVTSATVDGASGAGLDAVAGRGDVVVNASCDQPTAELLRVTAGLDCDYADLSADPASIAAMLDLDDQVRMRNRRALVGIGLSPGATNVLARTALEARPGAVRADTIVVLSVVDDFGPAAVDWTLRSLDPPPAMHRNGREVVVRPFGADRRLDLPGIGSIIAYEFPFPEQYFLPETLGVESSTSWCAFVPVSVGRVIAVVGRRRSLCRILTRPGVRARLARWAGRLPSPQRPRLVGAAGLAVDGEGATVVSLASRSESETTARCAHALLDHWPDATATQGVQLPESVVDPTSFLQRLSAAGMRIETTVVSGVTV